MEIENQEVKKSYSVFEKFMDYCPVTCLLMDDKGVILFANKSFLNTFKVSKKSIGKRILDVLPIDFAMMCLRNNDLLLELKFPINTVEKGILNDNKEHVFSICKFPINFEGNCIIGCWATEQIP
jgi:nitrogen-specific signal transduction histidine kinase